MFFLVYHFIWGQLSILKDVCKAFSLQRRLLVCNSVLNVDKESITNNLFLVPVYLHPLDVCGKPEGGELIKRVSDFRRIVSKESTCLGHQNIPGDRQCKTYTTMHSAPVTHVVPEIRGLLQEWANFSMAKLLHSNLTHKGNWYKSNHLLEFNFCGKWPREGGMGLIMFKISKLISIPPVGLRHYIFLNKDDDQLILQ